MSKLTEALDVVEEQLKISLEDGLFLAGLALQAESQRRCPVDTGALRASAGTRKHKVTRKSNWFGQSNIVVEVQVYYTQSYAIYVHENVGANFTVGQAKFLEEPARELGDKLGKIVASEMRKNGVRKPRIQDEEV